MTMCKHLVLEPLKHTVDSTMQKSCKPAMLGRMWRESSGAVVLHHAHAHDFAVSQWQAVDSTSPSTPYLIYRCSLFIMLTSIGISSFACQKLPKDIQGNKTIQYNKEMELNYMKWFIYFTNWGYLTLIVQSGLALAVVIKFRTQKKNNTHDVGDLSMPLLCRVYWLFHNIATDIAPVITVVYWTMVHNPSIHELDAINVLVHGANSIVVLVELAVTSHPVRFAHAVYGAGAGVAYGLFSAVYWAAGGTDRVGHTYVYTQLDWAKPGEAFGFVAVCAVVMVFAHAVAWVLVISRSWLALRLRPQPNCHNSPL